MQDLQAALGYRDSGEGKNAKKKEKKSFSQKNILENCRIIWMVLWLKKISEKEGKWV